MGHINIEINVNYGNEAMQSYEDAKIAIEQALAKVGGHNQQISIRDLNGNTVGDLVVSAK